MTFPFQPTMTTDVVDTPKVYDYTPSVVAGRMFWTCGLGTDCLVSSTWAGPPGAVYSRTDRLVADPAAVITSTGFAVAHTVGELDGTRNGINILRYDPNGTPVGPPVTVVPQSTRPGTYGFGQPSLAPLPDNAYLLVYRRDGTFGGSMLAAAVIDSRSFQVRYEVQFAGPEDGASPEVFITRGAVWLLLVAADGQGDGWAGLRRYQLVGSCLLRDVNAETVYPVTGGLFRALPGAVRLTNAVDGAGVVRNATNDPVIGPDGTLTFWSGWRNTLRRTADWRLVRRTIPLP